MIKHAIERNEIISVIKDTVDLEGYFTVWQRNPEGEIIFQLKATLVSVDGEGNLVFKLGRYLSLLRTDEVFFAADKAKVVYKSVRLKIVKNMLHCEIPDEIKYMERRKHPRKRFRKNEYKEVEVVCRLKEGTDEREESKKLISRLIDISEGGACFFLSKESLSMINLQEKIEIKSLAQDVKIEATVAIIVNARQVKGMTMSLEEMYAVGVMFL